MMERVVKFDTLGTTFIPRIFEAKDWAYLFGNFEDPIDELVKEFYSNVGYIAKVLLITRPVNVDLTLYDDR